MTSTERGGTVPVTVIRPELSPEPPTTAQTRTTTQTCSTFPTGEDPAVITITFITSLVSENFTVKQPQIAKVYFTSN